MFLAQISSISANPATSFFGIGMLILLLHMSGSQFQGQNIVCPENDIIFKCYVRGSSQHNEK